MERNPYLAENTARQAGGERTAVRRTNGAGAVRRSKAEIAARRRRRRKKLFYRRLIVFGCVGAVLILTGFLVGAALKGIVAAVTAHKEPEQTIDAVHIEDGMLSDKQPFENTVQGIESSVFWTHPEWEENFLTENEYSRPGDELKEVKNIFVHYTGNKGTSAKQNRSYFEQLKDTKERSASAHFIIGYDGEIIQCVPLDEIAYAVQTRNMDSISIECCYKKDNGQFTQETYDSLLLLLDWLTDVYDLDSEDILRHYDSGGKKCPLYYVEHEDAWKQLKRDVKAMK